MEILQPTPVSTFLNELHIVDHSANTEYDLQVASFESILSIKQRITVHAEEKLPYLPQYLFLAIQLKDGSYTPIEFQYVGDFPRPNTFPDPLTSPVPDRRFVTEENAQISVSIESYPGLTFDTIPFEEEPTLHLWTLRSLAAIADQNNTQIFMGYFHVYFPFIRTPHHVDETLYTSMTKDQTEIYTRLQKYQTNLKITLEKMETSIYEIESLHLIHSIYFHAKLPFLKSIKTDGLDILFNKLKGCKYIPFIRYFPQSGIPRLKLATGPSGVFMISSAQMLGQFLVDIPDVEYESILMIKTPIESYDPRVVQKGFAWTLLMHSNGHCEIQLNAYRSNEPITISLLEDAFKLLPKVLSSAGWEHDAVKDLDLSYFSGMYEVNIDLKHNLTLEELQSRVKQYIPFIYQEINPSSKVNGVALRSRIGSFPPQEDPYQKAMDIFKLNKVSNISAISPLLEKEFGISSKQIFSIIEKFNKRYQKGFDKDEEVKQTPTQELGATLFIENLSPRFLLRFEFVHSITELKQLLSIAYMIILGDTKVESVARRISTPVPSQTLTILDPEENVSAFDDPENEAVEELAPANKEKYDYVKYLVKADYNLFKFTAVPSLQIGAYSSTCQHAQERQPYVVSPNKYKDIRHRYEDYDVNIIEYPLSTHDANVVKFVIKSVDERRKFKASKKEKEAMEIHGLRLGIPLGEDLSCLGNDAPPRLNELIEEQSRKELWVVARAGSDPKKPNYYICSKLWCATDQLPILRSEYEGTTMRNGAKKKLVPSCPFCGEQNVIERKQENIYAGYFNKKKHPKGYVLPCCFASPDKLILPSESVPIPDPPKGMEPAYPDAETVVDESAKKADIVKNIGEAFKKINSSSTYLLKSNTSLTEGTVGTVPFAIDTLLGQSVDSYTESIKGNLKIGDTPHAFIRFGTGPNFLQFLSYILFVTARIGQGVSGISATSMFSPKDVLKWLTQTQMVKMARAIESANYGTLVREFYDPEEPDPGTVGSRYTILEFQKWMGDMELGSADRAHVIRFFKAWNRFVDYLSDPDPAVIKELRLWDGLLSTPGLFSKEGVVLLRIIPDFSKEGGAGELKCPSFGISKRTQEGQPCMIPIYYIENQSLIEPLIYVETKNEFIGAIHPSKVASYSKGSRKKLLDLYSQFLQSIVGCGRPIPPIHPWFASNTKLVRLGILFDFFKTKTDYIVHSILRERTNRTVGLLVEEDSNMYYIPTSDDGFASISTPSSYDLDAIPMPSYPNVIAFFTKLSATFSDLKPSKIRYMINSEGIKEYLQLEVSKNIYIPFTPFEEGVHTFTLPSLEISKIFYEEDSILLTKADEKSMKLMKDVEINPEELFEETYQYLRLSLSNWLVSDGHKVADQIELLRAARSRFPLYELRKRGDILLHTLIKSWITTEGESTIPPLLRQDCIQLKEGTCDGMCSWSEGRCKIHAPIHGHMEDPAVILTARLVDELLRTNGPAYEVLQKKEKRVQRLRTPSGIVKDGDTRVLSFEGRGDRDLYLRLGLTGRHRTKYTRGYIYPEEVSAEKLGREISTEYGLPVVWEDAGWSRSGELSDIVRKLPQLQEALLQSLLIDSNISYTDFEKELQELRPSHSKEHFSWSEQDLQILSNILKVNIVLTKKNERTGILEMKKVLQYESPQYIMLDAEYLPLLFTPSGSTPIHFVEINQLPEDIQIGIELL